MKRSLSFLTLLLLMSPFMHLHGQSGLRPRGDVNRDWEVTVADVNGLTDAIIAGTPYNSFYTYDHDINGDKEINLADVNLLVDALLGAELAPMPSFSGTLPVLYINTEGHRDITSREEYLHADWWLDAMGIEGYESIGTADAPLGMLIRGRGNYSWNYYDKKSFRLKLDNKQPLMGMDSNRHWCLLGHPDDYLARLKNTMGFELSRRIGLAYTPAQEPVEVVLNGEYVGLYFLTEKIRVGKHRVNIEEQQDNETDPAKITGGWLLEIDNNPTKGSCIYFSEVPGSNARRDTVALTYHSPEVLSKQQNQYLRQFIARANDAIHNSDKSSTEWERYIDIDTLAMYYIVGEMMDDLEYFAGSCFMYKHAGDSTRLIFGPVWDFGNAFQRWAIYGDTKFNRFIYEQPTNFNSHWIEEIVKFPRFQQAVRKHWRDFYSSGFNGLDIDGFVDRFVAKIKPAFQSEIVRKPQYDIEIQKINFKVFLDRKISWLNRMWGYPADVGSGPHEVQPAK